MSFFAKEKGVVKLFAHFSNGKGFEACIERKGDQYRTGWKSRPENNFFFVRCPFKIKQGWARYHYRTGKEVRIENWTTLTAANKEFQQIIKQSKTVNFK
jgi:hypothetical protein